MINAKLILKFMKDNKLSKKQFCEKAGLSVKTLNKLLNNDLSVNLRLIYKIIVFMRVKAGDIIKITTKN